MPGAAMHYLDANATQPLRTEALQAIIAALAVTGNPSSVHQAGRAARRIMEDARDAIAARFSARPQDVVFTAGGTEADAIAIHALAPGRRLIISAIEHDAVRAAAGEPLILPVGADGVADLPALETLLGDGTPSLVCLMLANNETGVIQPVEQAAAICRRHAALLHVDAVQGGGRLDVSLPALGAHSLAISSHKLGGPAGVGALLLAPDAPFAAPLTGGGGQERGRRGGTQPVALIAGFAAAVAASQSDDRAGMARLRDIVEQAALAAGAVVCGDPGNRLPNTTCLGLPGVRADAQVIALDLEQIAVSAGAACSSGKVAQSHVLRAMGLGDLAGQAIRVSLPWNVSRQDVEAFAVAYPRMAARLRSPLVPHAA
ncbi:cysteine desulfurase family protein [Rhodopila globiformis]|uniref:Cysteine desulfurase n=1 Tax=Rhodopila globiformis TaxID=1071 RepID=A0A2S6MWV7_RHOGL|nr:aminotransferase class V-fold PLP-dependent enzyme [Rhodopila globiformis]PPQ26841.1 cysteine desulfurase [Rhodopila globiformis]